MYIHTSNMTNPNNLTTLSPPPPPPSSLSPSQSLASLTLPALCFCVLYWVNSQETRKPAIVVVDDVVIAVIAWILFIFMCVCEWAYVRLAVWLHVWLCSSSVCQSGCVSEHESSWKILIILLVFVVARLQTSLACCAHVCVCVSEFTAGLGSGLCFGQRYLFFFSATW